MTPRSRQLALAALPVFVLLLAGAAWQWHQGTQTLWRFVSQGCLLAAQSGHGTGRCAEVSIERGADRGHVVFKDRNGPLQYLVMPTRRVSGVEDPFLLQPDAPAYWAEAWRARRWMAVSQGGPVPREAVSITVNPKWGRSQGQLHLHISCVRPDLRALLQSSPAAQSGTWTTLPGGWQGHAYEVRRVIADDLDGHDLFKEVARQHAGTMDRQGLAAIATRAGDGRNGFWFLRTQTDLPALWLGAIEGDVQDHTCAELQRGR